MGTRADFYVGRGEDAEWLGSIAWDGYPDGLPAYLRAARSEQQFRTEVRVFSRTRDDWTAPEDGWPWPWDDSNTTDYAYAFDDGRVWGSSFGRTWFLAAADEPEDDDGTSRSQDFPNMKGRKAVTFGPRSGVIVFGGGAA